MPDTRHYLTTAWAALSLLIAGCATVPTEYHEPASLGAADRTALNTRVFERTCELVNKKYFDASFHGVDWSAMRAQYRPEAVAAPDEESLYRVLNRLCAELKESHLQAFTPRQVHNGRFAQRETYRPESRELPGGFRYLRFASFNIGRFSWLSGEIKANRSAPGFIVDLRHNPGGHGNTLAIMLGQFFPQRIDFGRLTNRDGEPTEKSGSSLWFATYRGPLVVLTDGSTASAAEIFAHVLQYYKRATVVGRRTGGWVLLSFDYALPDGGRLVVPEQDYVGLDGQRLEGRGVTPDVVVPAPSLADLRAGRDPDLEAALNVLHQPDSAPGNKRRAESAPRSIDPQLNLPP